MTDRADGEEVFELELWGGATERRYRAARSETTTMPWGTLDLSRLSPGQIAEARRMWTAAAFQEHRTGAQCSATLRCLFECRAPLDLIAVFSRFPLDEVVHVELAARMAMELGGAVELRHTTNDVVRDPEPHPEALMRAAELVVKVFCVGETLSIPLLHASWQAAEQPLARAVLSRIVRDEAAHGIAGWTFLDWIEPFLEDEDRAVIGRHADAAIGEILKLWRNIRARNHAHAAQGNGIGWMGNEAYLALAERSLATRVVRPLRERGIPLDTEALPQSVR